LYITELPTQDTRRLLSVRNWSRCYLMITKETEIVE
jgi:hypothetical protein